jgi:hypothetical protein
MFEGEKCKNHTGFLLVSDDDVGATHEVDYNSLERVLGCRPPRIRLSQVSSYSARGGQFLD